MSTTNGATTFIPRRSGGVRHAPEADIESIRDLLRGYGSARSILKELIQNAEDAGATRMDVLHLPGDPASSLALLRGPGLLVANDGGFTEDHRDAITQISLGTKGTEERAIGRFGKGLKSIFAWCEAFFIIARTDPELGWQGNAITDFFNPWHGWRRGDWDDEFGNYGDILLGKTEHHLSTIYPAGKHWLALWFPLRHQAQAGGDQAAEEWIFPSLPGDDPEFYQKLSSELRSLTPSLVSLRSLQHIALVEYSDDPHNSLILDFPSQSQRIPAPDAAPSSVTPVDGTIILHTANGRDTPYRYYGIAGHVPNEEVARLKAASDWPQVVQRTHGQNSVNRRVKGEPHFATLIAWTSVNQAEISGSLDVRWCVFFPVGKQPPDKLPITLFGIRSHITINLHGFFFLDSERLRIDGLEERFSPNGPKAEGSCLEWNRILATRGTLARLPEALAGLAKQESFNDLECRELGDAIHETWLWQGFQKEICHLQTWRPRWRSGTETWGCISAQTPVFVIPVIVNPREVLAHVPKLAPISEEITLIAANDEGALPGIYYSKASLWPDELVLRLLENVELALTGDEATAAWLNGFLNNLHKDSALTPAIRERVADFHLLPARDPGTNESVRLSACEWAELVAKGHLFAGDAQTDRWIRMLRLALPDWSCHVESVEPPQWFTGPRAPSCNATMAADIVLGQATLGTFVHRARLVDVFASSIRRDSRPCLAMRYLMHADASHCHEGTKILFMPSTQHGEQVWPRLVEQLLRNDGSMDSWRLLHDQWAPVLSPQIQQELNVSTIDADGAWTELRRGQTDLSRLEFPHDNWSTSDVCALLQGLFQAGQSRHEDALPTLRKLRLHTLRGRPDERVSVAESEGKLAEGFVLDAPNVESSLTPKLRAIWERFLSETRIVELIPPDNLAAKVQQHIFEMVDNDGVIYLVELNWNFVVRRSLGSAVPSEWAPLIMEALSRQGSQSVRGVGQKFRDTAWLPLTLGGSIAPDYVVHIEGIEEDLHSLLDPIKDGWGSILALPESIREHAGFATLRNMLPGIEKALEALGLWLEDKSEWHLGLSKQFQMTELEPLLSQLEDFENLPTAALMANLRRISIRGRSEEVDPLLTRYILPSVLKSFDYRQDGLARVEAILQRLQGRQNRGAFDAYLGQACQDGVLATLLPNLSLVNQRGHWIPARQLIWPSVNLNPAAQLCADQAEILSSLHHGRTRGEPEAAGNEQGLALLRGHQLTEAPDFEAQADKLLKYLQPFRNSNVGENLPAALVAVLGGHPKTLNLLEELLQAGLKQQPDDFRALLLGDETDRLVQDIKSTRFLIEIIQGEHVKARTITDEEITVEFTDEISTLLVGDPSELWWSYYYQSRMETACHILRLRWIEDPDKLQEPVAVFASTIEAILLKVYCNGVSSQCPSDIKGVLSDIAEAGQSDLRRSRSYLLDMAEARLKELGGKDVPQLNAVLQNFAEARQARVDAEQLATRVPARAKQREEEARRLVEFAKRELKVLLEAPEENAAQRTLVDAVRRKMSDFQYGLGSIAFELFQNADDAVAELDEMQNKIDRRAQQFVLNLDSERRVLEVVHWGRPINRHEFPGFQEGLKRGYDQDLQKMLTLNFSDKGIAPEGRQAIVTGRFGLGFKSVFFVAEQPEVISGRLAFKIRGGFFPVPLSPETSEEMRERARTLSAPGLVPTVIRLKWTQQTQPQEFSKAIDDFTDAAPLLTIFARRINTVFVDHDATISRCTIIERHLTETGRATHAQVGNMAFLCFRCFLYCDQRPATVLFKLDSSGLSPLSDNLTGVWITTPTAERSDLKFALNAPFKPDAGRQRLALNNPENRTIATEVARVWAEALIELFDETNDRWNRFAELLKLHSSANFENWWRQLWKEMTRSSPVVHWEPIQGGNGGQILSWIAWGKSIGAMRGLVLQRAAIPSELPDDYVRMVMQRNVRFSVAGLLAKTDNGCFAHVARWESTQAAFPAGQTVRADIAEFLKHAEFITDVEKVTLERVLRAAVGPQHQVSHLIGERFGYLFVQCKSVFEPNTSDAPEIQQLLIWMKQLTLLGNDGAYHPANELVCGRALTEVIEADEALRAAFAPDSSVLSTDYSDSALRFFIKARERLTAGAPMLATWARDASHLKLPAVFRYLVYGELGQQLADELKRPWLDTKSETLAWRELSLEDRHEVERKFSRWNTSICTPIVFPPTPEITQVMDEEEAFRLVSAWWKEEQAHWVASYEEKTYPIGFPGTLPWPGEDEWDMASDPSAAARWLILFIHAALVPLGFNNIGRDQSFSQFLVSQRWLDVFAKASVEPEALLDALDDYLGGFIQNTQYHFQMRQFVAFYAVARNLEPLLLSLREAERSLVPGAFSLAFGPRANPALTGTGIDAPPLTGMLGIGSCQLLRELYRLRRLSNPLGHRFAFTPIRKVRRLCTLLFGVPEGISSTQSSEIIFDAVKKLGESLGLDPTFNHCFDLPLQFLGQNESLRTRVLKRKFDVEFLDETLDAAPQEVNLPWNQ